MNVSLLFRQAASPLAALCILAVCSGSLAADPVSEEQAGAESFTIIALPDTQVYSESFPDHFTKQTEWVKANKERLNIVCVVHEGDITNRNSEKEWEVADKALSVLDGVVPYCLAPGNHDTGPGGGRGDFQTAFLDEHFPPSRFEKKPWFGGAFEEDSIKNAYYTFEAAGAKYLVVCLEFGPRDEVLEWASKVVEEHKDRRAIIVTHCYMYSDDTRVGPGDAWTPHDYPNGGNDGEEIWTKLASRHENVFLVISGHILNDGTGRQTSTGEHGNAVHELLANYQMRREGGEGWLRVMTFKPAEQQIVVRTYSPVLDKELDDNENAFVLEWKTK